MRKPYYWQQWSDEDILDLPLKDLGLRLEGTYIEKAIVQIFDELRKNNILFRPHFWISDEWFCPEGVPGVAVPFYLLHPRMRKIEREYVGEIEGSTYQGALKILRHEVGHAFEEAHKLVKHPLRISAFGDSRNKPYPVSYEPQPNNGKFVVNLGSGYAQSHPDEDFAETFAVFVDPKSNWQERYQNLPVMEKLLAMEELLKEYGGKLAKKRSRREVDPIEKQETSFRQYLSSKRRKYRIKDNIETDKNLLNVFEPLVVNQRGRRANIFIRNNKDELVYEISTSTGRKKKDIKKLVELWQKRSKKMNLVLKDQEASTKRQVLDLLTMEALEDLQQGRDKIIL